MQITREDIDAFGELTSFHVRDSNIIGFSFEDPKELVLKLHRADKPQLNIVFRGIERFGIVDFTNESTVSRILIWGLEAVPAAALNVPNGAWSVLVANDLWQADITRLAQRITAEKQKDFWLISVECSSGGAMAALCQSVEALELPR